MDRGEAKVDPEGISLQIFILISDETRFAYRVQGAIEQ